MTALDLWTPVGNRRDRRLRMLSSYPRHAITHDRWTASQRNVDDRTQRIAIG